MYLTALFLCAKPFYKGLELKDQLVVIPGFFYCKDKSLNKLSLIKRIMNIVHNTALRI